MVARAMANILHSIGTLSEGKLIEVGRADLVAEYIGQTAVKTNSVIDKAIGGILFIDEAYSLCNGPHDDYGREAINTLLQRMENDRDKFVVILAGYDKEMKQLIDSNPGLQSRFTRMVYFMDYSIRELEDIFDSIMRECQFFFGRGARQKLHNILIERLKTGTPTSATVDISATYSKTPYKNKHYASCTSSTPLPDSSAPSPPKIYKHYNNEIRIMECQRPARRHAQRLRPNIPQP